MVEKAPDLRLENSLQFEHSNISNALKPLYEKELMEATNSVTGIASYKKLITDIINRANETIPLDYLATIIPTATPSGKVVSFGNRLAGKQSQSTIISDNLKIFKMDDATGFSEDDVITSGTATGTVLYVESPFMLVKVTANSFAPNNIIGTKTLKALYNPVHMLGVFLPNYIGSYSTADGENITDFKQIDFAMGEIDIECKTRKGLSGITLEAMQDLISLYGVKYRATLINMLTAIMKTIELNDIFVYQRANAYNRPDIVLDDSFGIQSSLNEVYMDIFNRINQSIGQISSNTGTSGFYSVSASSKVIAGLKTALKSDMYEDEGILYLPGGVPLIEDGYAITDYFCVSLIGPDQNSAMIFAPYDIMVVEAQSSENFQKQIMVMDRYDIIDNPLVTRLNDQSKNEMMEITHVSGFELLKNEF